jgi:hypothetical protein
LNMVTPITARTTSSQSHIGIKTSRMLRFPLYRQWSSGFREFTP